MKNPFYTLLAFLSCSYLLAANTQGWSFWQNRSNRASYYNTSYRYRPSFTSSSSGGSWFSGGGFHK